MVQSNQRTYKIIRLLCLSSLGNRERKRTVLLILYYIGSIGLIFLFHPGPEAERLQPLALLSSWASLLMLFLGKLVIDVPKTQLGSIETVILFLNLFLLYLIVLALLTTRLSRIIRTSLPIFQIVVHGSGIMLFFLMTRHVRPYKLSAFDLSGCAIIIIMVLAYFAVDWNLARGRLHTKMEAESANHS